MPHWSSHQELTSRWSARCAELLLEECVEVFKLQSIVTSNGPPSNLTGGRLFSLRQIKKMERRNSCRNLVVPTSAARIAIARNNRETLLLAKTSKGLSCQSNWTARCFYKEKAKANSFLQEVYNHSKNSSSLKAKWDGNGSNVTAEKSIGIIAKSAARNVVQSQQVRLPSVNQAGKRERAEARGLQKHLRADTPGSPTEDKENEQMKERKTGSEHIDTTPEEISKAEEDCKRNVRTPRPFKVRSRTSGICFACTQLHVKNFSGMELPKMTKICHLSSDVPWKTCKTHFRKLSLPVGVSRRMSLKQNSICDVSTPFLPCTEREAKLG